MTLRLLPTVLVALLSAVTVLTRRLSGSGADWQLGYLGGLAGGGACVLLFLGLYLPCRRAR